VNMRAAAVRVSFPFILGVAVGVTTGVAGAATVNCTGGTCFGTGSADTINGSGGDDTIAAGDGGDTVFGPTCASQVGDRGRSGLSVVTA
jgi:Ca2+-binding RTX toxin-like protein